MWKSLTNSGSKSLPKIILEKFPKFVPKILRLKTMVKIPLNYLEKLYPKALPKIMLEKSPNFIPKILRVKKGQVPLKISWKNMPKILTKIRAWKIPKVYPQNPPPKKKSKIPQIYLEKLCPKSLPKIMLEKSPKFVPKILLLKWPKSPLTIFWKIMPKILTKIHAWKIPKFYPQNPPPKKNCSKSPQNYLEKLCLNLQRPKRSPLLLVVVLPNSKKKSGYIIQKKSSGFFAKKVMKKSWKFDLSFKSSAPFLFSVAHAARHLIKVRTPLTFWVRVHYGFPLFVMYPDPKG